MTQLIELTASELDLVAGRDSAGNVMAVKIDIPVATLPSVAVAVAADFTFALAVAIGPDAAVEVSAKAESFVAASTG